MARPIVDLKRCPFCGAEAQVRTFDRKTYYITCSGCRADSGGYDTLFDAAAAWNKRTKGETQNEGADATGNREV